MGKNFLENAEADYDDAIKSYDKAMKKTDILDKIAYFLIIAGMIIAFLWICSIVMTIIASGWESGEVHRVNIMYPIAVIFHMTGLIYYGLPLAAVLAGGGYLLEKYDRKQMRIAHDVGMAKKERYLAAMKRDNERINEDNKKESDGKNNRLDNSSTGSYCYNCGKKLSNKHKFCPDCGTKIDKAKIS